MKKKILVSLSIIGLMAAIAIGGTIAYFSDTETSSGNTFTAGTLNLTIDNECYYNGKKCVYVKPGLYRWEGTFEECFCTWGLTDLDGELFFDFEDLKPGDWGEDTVSLHVDNNDAWACMKISNLVDQDNGCNEPEAKVDSPLTSCNNPGEGEGELQSYLFFTIWRDSDCDNILDAGEVVLYGENTIENEIIISIADETTGTGPMIASQNYCIGMGWIIPSDTGNIIQSDSFAGDVSFYAVQSKNNPNFVCVNLKPLGEYLVINEVLYDAVIEPDGEWIEIYNPTNNTIDISNYKLGDEETQGGGEGMYEFPEGTSISAGEFKVVANRAAAFFAIYGFKPDFEFIDSDPTVPNMIKYPAWASGSVYLANTGDEVLLLDENDNPVDVVTYEDGSYSGVVPHPGVAEGHSISRSPAGVDTNDCSVDFVDLLSPTPGGG